MLLAYLTADEANWDLAVQLADDCGIRLFLGDWAAVKAQGVFMQTADESGAFLDPLPFNGLGSAVRPDAVAYDVDSLSSERRREVLSKLMAGLACCPVAVQSCRLGETEKLALRVNGVAIFPGIDPEMFWLLRLMLNGRGPSPEADTFPVCPLKPGLPLA